MPKKQEPRVELPEQTVTVRLNRKLAVEGLRVRKARVGPSRDALGLYYITKIKTGDLVESHADLEELGRRFGTLKPFEHLDRSTVKT